MFSPIGRVKATKLFALQDLLVCRRNLSIHEHQSMGLLAKYGVPTPRGEVAKTPEEAYRIAESFKTDDLVIKAQVLAGGRGKGKFDTGFAGGVHSACSAEEVRSYAAQMLGKKLITKQTGASGRLCNSVFVCERIFTRKDYYLAVLLDRKTNGILLMGSQRGGMDIEAVAAEDPSAIVTLPVCNDGEIKDEELIKFIRNMVIPEKNIGETGQLIRSLVRLFCAKDATLVEINPLSETIQGKMVCLDAKINFDENADFRQKELFALRDTSQEDAREVRASEYRLNYIGLEGQIGCLVNGAGLAMATMDIIKLHGGEPANFLDVGGGATAEQVEQAIRILGEDPSVKAILVNIFGGIMRCDVIAQGIIQAAEHMKLKIPMVVRLLGTNVTEAKELLENSGLELFACDDLDEAAQKAVTLSKIVELSRAANIQVKIEDPRSASHL